MKYRLGLFHRIPAHQWGVCLTLILCIMSLSYVSFAQQRVDKLTCVSTVFAPYVIEEQDDIVGIDVDVIQEAGRRLGIEIDFKLKPWKRLEVDMQRGEETCVAAYFRTPERLDYMDFTHVPLHITNYTLFVLEERDITFHSLEDIQGFSIGVNRGFKTTPEFEDALQKGWITEQEVNEDRQNFIKLEAGRVDAVLTNFHVGSYQIKLLGLQDVTSLFPPLSSTPAYFVFSKKKGLSHLVPKFDAALFDILQDGTYQKIFEKYTKITKEE